MSAMTAARQLATDPTGPLGPVLIDRLTRELRQDVAEPAGADSSAVGASPVDDPGHGGAPTSPAIPLPSLCAAALLLGRALDSHREELARLQDPDTIALVVVPSPDLVDPVRDLLKRHVIGPDNVLASAELRNGGPGPVDAGTVAIFVDTDDGRSTKSDKTDELIAAVRAGCALIGVSSDPDRLLPAAMVRMATVKVVLPRLHSEVVRDVIRTVTGVDPGVVEADLATAATGQALDLTLRSDLGAARSLDRLRLLLGAASARKSVPSVRLSEMHGLGDARNWALDLIADLKAYARGDLADLPPGAVLWSRPGCGKTAVARALAREAACEFVATSYAEWQSRREGHLGHVVQAIRETFAEARRRAPCIVFIDEIDTLGSRGSSKRDEDWWRAIINTLLEQLDGFDRRKGVIVLGACNDPERLDPALVRSGRLDRLIEIPLPDVPALAGIFRTYLRDDLAGESLIDVALIAHGGTGADVERAVRDARAVARRAGRPLTKQDLVWAVRGQRGELPEQVRRRIAHHEAGHAIAIVATGIGSPVSISVGDKGGWSHNELGERRSLTRGHLENHLVVLLSGRAAEVLVFGEGTAGAGGSEDSDLARATVVATQIETAFGLGSSGLLYAPIDPRSPFFLTAEVRSAVGKTLDRMHKAASDLLARNRATLDALADALFEAGYLDAEAIRRVLHSHPLAEGPSTEQPVLPPERSQVARLPAGHPPC